MKVEIKQACMRFITESHFNIALCVYAEGPVVSAVALSAGLHSIRHFPDEKIRFLTETSDSSFYIFRHLVGADVFYIDRNTQEDEKKFLPSNFVQFFSLKMQQRATASLLTSTGIISQFWQ